jgi:hypothetical protein
MTGPAALEASAQELHYRMTDDGFFIFGVPGERQLPAFATGRFWHAAVTHSSPANW